jgi:hypothetical protein
MRVSWVSGSVARFLRARNQQGYDIYLLPYAEQCNAGYILIDLDHATADVLPRMRASGHEPCVVLQSSPGHLQAWIRVSTIPLEPALATAVSKQLARTYGGDLASTDGCHLGRLAGFTNQKLQRRTATGYAPLKTKPLFAESQEHHRTGFQLLSEGSYAKAREQFLKAIEKNPDGASRHRPLPVLDT